MIDIRRFKELNQDQKDQVIQCLLDGLGLTIFIRSGSERVWIKSPEEMTGTEEDAVSFYDDDNAVDAQV